MTDIQSLEADLLSRIADAQTPDAVEAIRVAALGKSGSVTALLKTLGRARRSLTYFAMIFLILIAAFSGAYTLAFGTQSLPHVQGA